jgi:cyclophilin family peptidyl-prolyl cis-trans isomerase
VACANANAPHTNGSQFFITLDRTDGLNKKNTIFGKVTGDTIYNLANMNELEVDDDDRCHDLGARVIKRASEPYPLMGRAFASSYCSSSQRRHSCGFDASL